MIYDGRETSARAVNGWYSDIQNYFDQVYFAHDHDHTLNMSCIVYILQNMHDYTN